MFSLRRIIPETQLHSHVYGGIMASCSVICSVICCVFNVSCFSTATMYLIRITQLQYCNYIVIVFEVAESFISPPARCTVEKVTPQKEKKKWKFFKMRAHFCKEGKYKYCKHVEITSSCRSITALHECFLF